jgi:hypothetical protein
MDNKKLKFKGSDKVRALLTFIDGLPEKASGVLPHDKDNEPEPTIEDMQALIELIQEKIKQKTECNEPETE